MGCHLRDQSSGVCKTHINLECVSAAHYSLKVDVRLSDDRGVCESRKADREKKKGAEGTPEKVWL